MYQTRQATRSMATYLHFYKATIIFFEQMKISNEYLQFTFYLTLLTLKEEKSYKSKIKKKLKCVNFGVNLGHSGYGLTHKILIALKFDSFIDASYVSIFVAITAFCKLLASIWWQIHFLN